MTKIIYWHAGEQKHVVAGVQFTLSAGSDAIQYPAGWLDVATPGDIDAIGLVSVAVAGQRGDDRFYDNAEVLDGPTLTITATLKPLDLCQREQVAAIKAQAALLLQPTDWMITRAAEGIKPVPEDVLAQRAAIRAASNAAEAAIMAAQDVEALAAVVDGITWPQV